MTGKQPVTFEGRLAGYATMVGPDTVSVELLPEMAGLLGEGLVGGLSIGPRIEATAAAGVGSVFKTTEDKMRELRDSALKVGEPTGPSPSVAAVPEPVAGDWGRNSYTFRAEPELIEAMRWPGRMLERNRRAIQEELETDWRAPAVPESFRFLSLEDVETVPRSENWVKVRPVSVEGVEACGLLCGSEHHSRPVPAVVVGDFRVPWWEEGRSERATYCQHCARMAVFMGYFVPDFEGWQG